MNHRLPNVFLPEELVAEVLSFLPVKSLLRLSCVGKSLNSLISDPTFVKRHLHRSGRNADLTLVSPSFGKVSLTTFRLSENPPITMSLLEDPYHQLRDKDCRFIVGSCNGLICLVGLSYVDSHTKMYLRFWNPATRIISEKFGYSIQNCICFPFNFAFGYDDSTDTYKMVFFFPKRPDVSVFSFGKNVWRHIQNSPVVHNHKDEYVVRLSGSVNWLAINGYIMNNYDCKDISIKQFVIISLDLSTEIHTQLLLPQGFHEVPYIIPNLSVLKDCLCFSHDFKQTHFVIWQMKEFGVEDSWTQYLQISYHNLQIDYSLTGLLPLCLSEKNDILLLIQRFPGQIILYNWRDNRIERILKSWQYNSKDYVESLVWYC